MFDILLPAWQALLWAAVGRGSDVPGRLGENPSLGTALTFQVQQEASVSREALGWMMGGTLLSSCLSPELSFFDTRVGLKRCYPRIHPAAVVSLRVPAAVYKTLRRAPHLRFDASPPRERVAVSSRPGFQLSVAAVVSFGGCVPDVVADGTAGLPPPLPPLPQKPSLVLPGCSLARRPLSVPRFLQLIVPHVVLLMMLRLGVQNEREVRRGVASQVLIGPVGVSLQRPHCSRSGLSPVAPGGLSAVILLLAVVQRILARLMSVTVAVCKMVGNVRTKLTNVLPSVSSYYTCLTRADALQMLH